VNDDVIDLKFCDNGHVQYLCIKCFKQELAVLLTG